MKWRFVFYAIILSLGPHFVHAQNFDYVDNDPAAVPKTKVNSFFLKVNPLSILQGPIPVTSEFRLGFEGVISPKFSYQLAASVLTKSIFFNALFPDSGILWHYW